MDEVATPPGTEVAPAESLEGMTVCEGRWSVVRRIRPQAGHTGGFFSVGYVVEQLNDSGVPTGNRAFLKALDYSKWPCLGVPFADALASLSAAFVFERDLVQECANRRMSNVVLGIDSGEVVVPGHGELSPVSFIVFEEASGDVRKRMDAQVLFDNAWALRVLHNVANGLRQLHQANIAHQDLKPSNVLLFEDQSKIGDLGRAFQPGTTPPHAGAIVPGDSTYAPPELLYGQADPDATLRCRAAEAYHLGSMVAFMFTKVSVTAAIASHIDPNLWYRSWGGTYTQALPHVRDAFDHAVGDLEAELPEILRGDVAALVRELCDPDPRQRGNPKRTGVQRYSMERYVSILDRLSRRTETTLRSKFS